MHKMTLCALGAVAMAWAVPAASQELPVVPGDYWDVQGIKIDDGHFAEYADFLASDFRKESEFAKSKGWMKGYYMLENVNARADEPNLYLIRIYDHMPTAAEQVQRQKEMTAFVGSTTRQQLAQSGARGSYRHIGSNELLQVLNFAH